MQALLPTALPQDENAMATPRGKGTTSGSFRSFGTPATGKASAPMSARKALGNITNMGKTPGKTPFTSRKALGDITNATPAKAQASASKAQSSQAITKTPKAQAVETLMQKAERYAEDGVEELAGWGWAQQEAERVRREDEEISQKVARVNFRVDMSPYPMAGDDKCETSFSDGLEMDPAFASLDCPGNHSAGLGNLGDDLLFEGVGEDCLPDVGGGALDWGVCSDTEDDV